MALLIDRRIASSRENARE